MYAVVGCGECSALWIVEGRPETSQCPRCGTTRAYEKRRQFVTTDDEDHAREVRSSMLATRQDLGEEFAELDSFAEMADYVDDAGMDEEAYLREAGVDTAAVAAAGKRSERGAGASGGSRKDIIEEALRTLDAPDEEAVVSYAGERGVPAEYARKALRKLERSGAVTRRDGGYRLV